MRVSARFGAVAFFCCLVSLFANSLAALACGGCGGGTCAGGFGCGCGCGVVGGTDGGAGGGSSVNGSFQASNIEMKSRMALSEISGGRTDVVGSAIWGWTSATGREIAIFGLSNGTSFVDVTDATNPVFLGQMKTTAGTGETVWREVQTYGDRVYVVSDANGAHGVQVFDLKNLPDLGNPNTNFNTPLTFTPTSTYTGVTNVHTISINQQTGFAYLNGSNTGQQILNLANPDAPVGVTSYTANGYTHDSQIVKYNGPDAAHAGREIAFNSNGSSGFAIVDMTDKMNIQTLSSSVYNGLGYTHQGALTEDQRYFLMDDEFDELNNQNDPNRKTTTRIWDVRDLDNPVYLGAYEHDTRAIDHNMFIKDGYVYQSNYTSGLRVLKIGDLDAIAAGLQPVSSALTQVAYFDTYNQDDSNPEVSFNGQWGNYAYFAGNKVIAGDRNNGLFVLQVNASVFATPEPGTLVLMGLGLVGAGIGFARRRKR